MKKIRKENRKNLILAAEIFAVIVKLTIVTGLLFDQIFYYQVHAQSPLTEETIINDNTDDTEEAEDSSLPESLFEVAQIYPIAEDTDVTINDNHESDIDVDSIAGYMGNTVDDEELNIVVMGDSIWDYYRDNENVGSLVEEYLQEAFPNQTVHVYNLSIGGTSAALSADSSTDIDGWRHTNITGVTYALTGVTEDKSYLEGPDAYDVLPEVNLEKVDYFVISYGLNDYFCGNPVSSSDRCDLHSYSGAIEDSIERLHNNCPSARFLVMSPTYCQFYYYDQVDSTCLDRDYGGGGTLDKYVDGAKMVALEYGTLYQDAFNDYNLGADTQFIYTRDGVHFNTPGREKYASQVADCLADDYRQILIINTKDDLLP